MGEGDQKEKKKKIGFTEDFSWECIKSEGIGRLISKFIKI